MNYKRKIMAKVKKYSQTKYLSDEEIAKEFEGFKILDIQLGKKQFNQGGMWGNVKIDSYYSQPVKVILEFPVGGESVAGGRGGEGDEIVEYTSIMFDENGNYKRFGGFENWYPEEVALKIKNAIIEKANI